MGLPRRASTTRFASKSIYDKVCFIIRIDESVKVAGGFTKQDVAIADSTSVKD